MRVTGNVIKVDVAIIGGGIAGLWLLSRLRARGYGALLIESERLGSGQTICSQGIIHGGAKYSLRGQVSESAKAVAEMPALWRRCLKGEGEVDLHGAALLAEHQYLWATRSPTSRLVAFFASRLLRSRMEKVAAGVGADDYPPALRHPAFRGTVYRLDEPIIDIASVLAVLAESSMSTSGILRQYGVTPKSIQDARASGKIVRKDTTARDVVAEAKSGDARPVYFRESLLRDIMNVLSQSVNRHLILVGPDGQADPRRGLQDLRHRGGPAGCRQIRLLDLFQHGAGLIRGRQRRQEGCRIAQAEEQLQPRLGEEMAQHLHPFARRVVELPRVQRPFRHRQEIVRREHHTAHVVLVENPVEQRLLVDSKESVQRLDPLVAQAGVGREKVGRAHGRWFGDVRPASTMIAGAVLLRPECSNHPWLWCHSGT